MILVIVFMSLFFSLIFAYAFKGYGPKAMVIAGAANFTAYMLGLWALGAFSG